MGNKISVNYTQEELDSFKLATVKKVNSDGADLYDLFLSKSKKVTEEEQLIVFEGIFILPKDVHKSEIKNRRHQCEFYIAFDNFIAVSN